MHLARWIAVSALFTFADLTFAQTPKTVVVNEYFGVKYQQEPVSFDADFAPPVPAGNIFLDKGPSQVEVLEGTRDAVKRARVWTLVDFDAAGQQVFTIQTGKKDERGPGAIKVEPAGEMGGVKLATISNGQFFAKVPVGGAVFADGKSAFEIPGPVVSVSSDGKTWYGSGYLDTILRCKSVTCETDSGPVYFESRLVYTFENDKTYKVRVRLYPSKQYAALVEDFNLGGNARFIFNYDDWAPPWYISCSDQAQTKVYSTEGADASDFVKEEGSRCLVRMVVWTQFGYFGGKSETIGLASEDGSTAVGGFFIRPDLWTRAKVNHVDLYERPEIPGDRQTRGVVGLSGARNRYAMEAWLIDGHREWALFVMPTGPITPSTAPPGAPQGKGPEKKSPPKVEWSKLRKAHVVEGVWPLDRLNRIALVWNSDGTPVTIENQKVERPVGGIGDVVLKAMDGRSGLQAFNGSEGRLRGTAPPPTGWNGTVNPTRPEDQTAGEAPRRGAAPAPGRRIHGMIETAACAYFSEDESAYPSFRSMLPWTHPEALNPFYQGMENMNFNADRYRYVFTYGLRLAAMGHPEAKRFIDHGIKSFDMALDRYVYPQSGCWEESHGYAGHTIKTVAPMILAAANSGLRNFADDVRFAKMIEFFMYVHSPRDAAFGKRIVPPVGDHGLSTAGPAGRFKGSIDVFLAARNPEVRKILAQIAWTIQEDGGTPPAGIEPVKPDLSSRYLQGYGVVMRAADRQAKESFVVLRSEQSWGHHHEDKGSLWGWFGNVHFFGDCEWGGPPGGTYWNQYKQGPASGTQIEFVGINNWTLPCKYPSPWISDDQYQPGAFDYANARCMYPYNPRLDLARSSPSATANGYDRQTLLVHPDPAVDASPALLIVRDNVRSTVPTIWRMHSYQPAGTTLFDGGATLASNHGMTGHLGMLHPQGVKFTRIDGHDLNGSNAPFKSSCVLKWEMPLNHSATWTFSATADGQSAPKSESLDKDGRVTRAKLADGREITALLNIEPFTYSGEGIEFEGTVGLVIRKDGKTTTHAIRAARLTAR